jgi:hypothetical protein
MDQSPAERRASYFEPHITPEDAERLSARQDAVHSLHTSGQLTEAILDYYKGDKDRFYTVTINGEDYTNAVLSPPTWRRPTQGLNSIIGETSHKLQTHYDSDGLRRVLKQTAYNRAIDSGMDFPTTVDITDYFYNGLTYRVSNSSVQDDSPPVFDITLTDYISYISTAESFLQETYDSLLDRKSLDTPRRQKLAPSVDKLLDLSNSVHKFGLVVLTALAREDGGVDVLLSARSNLVTEYPGLYSLVPGGAAQPLHADFYETDLEFNLLRECAEELLSFPEVESLDVDDDDEPEEVLDSYKSREPLNRLYSALRNDEMALWYTNANITAFNGKFDIGGLLYVEDVELANWMRENISSNWESEAEHDVFTHPVEQVPDLYLSHELCPTAYVTLFEGLQLLRDEYGVELGFEISTK